ncbi:MAG: hypothetical protein V1725_06755 [archaeon]
MHERLHISAEGLDTLMNKTLPAARSALAEWKESVAGILVKGDNVWTPALIEVHDDTYDISPVVAVHGVGSHKTGDSYTDLVQIMQNGFSGRNGPFNAYGGNDVEAPSVWMQPSQREETKGDKYWLTVLKFQPNAVMSREVERVKNGRFPLAIKSAQSQDIVANIMLASNLSKAEQNRRLALYLQLSGTISIHNYASTNKIE